MALKENLIKNLALTHIEEKKHNDIWESNNHIFIFSKIDDDMKVRRKRANQVHGGNDKK